MKHIVLLHTALAFFTLSRTAAPPVRVLIWDEQQPQQKQAYYDKFLGETIAVEQEQFARTN